MVNIVTPLLLGSYVLKKVGDRGSVPKEHQKA